MGKNKAQGFDYYLTKEAIDRYREKPFELRLQWLYMGNVLRNGLSKEIIQLHSRFREGKNF